MNLFRVERLSVVAGAQGRVIRDPIYQYITIPASLSRLVDHAIIQRLRRISQTSLASSVYPSMTGSRFEHALGAMHLAGYAWTAAWRNSVQARAPFEVAVQRTVRIPDGTDFEQLVHDAVSCVALLHDVGHAPYSHALESLYERDAADILSDPTVVADYSARAPLSRFHEFAGEYLTRDLVRALLPPHLRDLVLEIYQPAGRSSWAMALKSLVAGEIDVDRIDYLMRDSQRAGTEYGAIDYIRLLDALEIHELDGRFMIAPGVRARPAAEHLLVQRSLAYRWIYFHPRVVAADLCMLRAVESLRELARTESSIVKMQSRSISASSIFRSLIPRLDYLTPPGTLADTLAGRLETREVGNVPTSTLQQVLEQLPGDVEAQALVDDSTIVECLKRASVWARALLAQNVGGDLEMLLRRFLAYYDAALMREKNFWPCWKSYEEYSGVVSELRIRGELADALSDAFAQMMRDPQAADNAEVIDFLQEQRDALLKPLDASTLEAVPVVNRVVSLLWRFDPGALPAHLNLTPMPLSREKGFWDAAFRSYDAVKSGRQVSVLFRENQVIPLRNTSPVVQGLAHQELQGVKLFIFFFRMLSSTSTHAWTNTEIRDALRGVFVDQFPRFVRERYASAYTALMFKSPSNELTVGANDE